MKTVNNMRILICLLVLFFSCSTPYKFTQRELPLSESRAAQMVVPKGYSKVERLDTVGRTDEIYHYGGGTIFYFSTITSGNHEWIDTTRHVPKVHPNGAVLYKGMTEGPIWWRETTRP